MLEFWIFFLDGSWIFFYVIGLRDVVLCDEVYMSLIDFD